MSRGWDCSSAQDICRRGGLAGEVGDSGRIGAADNDSILTYAHFGHLESNLPAPGLLTWFGFLGVILFFPVNLAHDSVALVLRLGVSLVTLPVWSAGSFVDLVSRRPLGRYDLTDVVHACVLRVF